MLKDLFNLQKSSILRFTREQFSLYCDSGDKEECAQSIENASRMRGANLWILIVAIVVCSVGLNINSTAVIIGAMLISP